MCVFLVSKGRYNAQRQEIYVFAIMTRNVIWSKSIELYVEKNIYNIRFVRVYYITHLQTHIYFLANKGMFLSRNLRNELFQWNEFALPKSYLYISTFFLPSFHTFSFCIIFFVEINSYFFSIGSKMVKTCIEKYLKSRLPEEMWHRLCDLNIFTPFRTFFIFSYYILRW